MEQLVVLGTGNAMVTKCFNTCFVVDCGSDGCLMVDTGGGNGVLGMLDRAGIDVRRIRHLFVTHAHTDHILGVPWLLRRVGALMLKDACDGDLVIHANRTVEQAIRTICGLTVQKKFTDLFDRRVRFDVLEDGATRNILGREALFFDIRSDKAPQFGVRLGLKSGKSLCCIGDEPCGPDCERVARGADWLLCEAFCLYADRERFRPYEKRHSTVREACELAERLGVGHLVLWHSEDETYDRRAEAYAAEGRRFFRGELVVPRDLDRVALS